MTLTRLSSWSLAIIVHLAAVAALLAWSEPEPPDFGAEENPGPFSITTFDPIIIGCGFCRAQPEDICEVHGITMTLAPMQPAKGLSILLARPTQPTSSASADPSAPSDAVRTQCFPHSQLPATCGIGGHALYVCRECQQAEDEWRAANSPAK